jgi:hypothetical protein
MDTKNCSCLKNEKKKKKYIFHGIKIVLQHEKNTTILTKTVLPDTRPSLVLTLRRLKFIEMKHKTLVPTYLAHKTIRAHYTDQP